MHLREAVFREQASIQDQPYIFEVTGWGDRLMRQLHSGVCWLCGLIIMYFHSLIFHKFYDKMQPSWLWKMIF